MSDQPICLVFALVAELCIALGEAPATKHPLCWELDVDSHWRIAFNAHDSLRPSNGIPVPPYNVAVWFNGWPAGLFDPVGGHFAAGTVANEDAFITALRARISAIEEASA